MTDENAQFGKYFNRLSKSDREQLEQRKERYEDQLRAQGYDVAVAEGEHGFFAGVLVIDSDEGRFGFLEDNGSITWITGNVGGIGALGSAIVQNPSEHLEQRAEGLENVEVE